MHGPYSAKKVGGTKTIVYKGNNIFPPIKNVSRVEFLNEPVKSRLDKVAYSEQFYHLHKIDNGIFFATVEYFKKIDAEWCNLPLTTLMISSPGEVHAGKLIDYTTDTLPVNLSWFKNKREIFLSESSQFYLEIRLLNEKINKVFSVYNSFRKEKADFSHLSEFQHIEFEGKVSFSENTKIAIGLMQHIVSYLLAKHKESLFYFLSKKEVGGLSRVFSPENFILITFSEALKMLYIDTQDKRYEKFSMEHFSSWEEIRLTELVGKHVILTEFPLLQISFYHNAKNTREGSTTAENADIILYGFRETIGSGVRITNPKTLLQKAKIFNLPKEDYLPYLATRDYSHYKQTAGFGLGWQRFIHWLLKLPYIWESTHLPRGHHLPNI